METVVTTKAGVTAPSSFPPSASSPFADTRARILEPHPFPNTWDADYGRRVILWSRYQAAADALAFVNDVNAQRRRWEREQALEDMVEKKQLHDFRPASAADIARAEARVQVAAAEIDVYLAARDRAHAVTHGNVPTNAYGRAA